MEYKKEKGLYFQDFKELVMFLNNLYKTDIVLLFESKFPLYFCRKKDEILYEFHYLEKTTGPKLIGTLQTTKLNSYSK